MSEHSELPFDEIHVAKTKAGTDAAKGTPDGLGDLYWAYDLNGGSLYGTNTAGNAWVLAGGAGNSLAKVSSADTTAGYLSDKIVAGTNVTLTILTPGGNETLRIAAALSTIDASAVTYTPSTLANWNGGVDPGATDDALDQLAARTKTLETNAGKAFASSTDAVAGTINYLDQKIVAGANVSINVIGAGVNKQLEIAASGGGGGTDGDAQEMGWLGMPISGVVGAKKLAAGQLPNTKTTLYTVPGATTTRVTAIYLENTNTTPEEVSIYAKASGGTSRLVERVVLAGSAVYHLEMDAPLIVDAAGVIEGETTTAAFVNYWINGGERTTPVSGVILKHLFDDQDPGGGFSTAYTVPASTITSLAHIAIGISADPGGTIGALCEVKIVSGSDEVLIFQSCLHFNNVVHIYPQVFLETGDEIQISTDNGSVADYWIDGAEVV